MNIIYWIILGGVAGWIASLITGGGYGVLGDIILGILGAIIGGWVMTLIGSSGVTGFNLPSLLVAVLGSILLIWIGRGLRTGRSA